MQGALLVTQAVKNYKKRNIGREERRKEERGRVDVDADDAELPRPRHVEAAVATALLKAAVAKTLLETERGERWRGAKREK